MTDEILFFIENKLPDIIAYALIAVNIITTIIIKFKSSKSGKLLHAVMKEKVEYVDKTNTELKMSTEEKTGKISKTFEDSSKRIELLENTLNDYEKKIKKLEAIIEMIVKEDSDE